MERFRSIMKIHPERKLNAERGLDETMCVCVNLTLANPSARVRCHSSPQGWQSH